MRSFPKNFLPNNPARRSLYSALGVTGLLSSMFALSGCVSQSLTAITVEPGVGLTCVIPGVSAQYKAYGSYTESGHATRTEDITAQVTWSATIPAVAAINSTGLATGMGLGTTAIIATTQGAFGNLRSTSNIDVQTSCGTASSARPLASLTILPGTEQLSEAGNSAQFLAVGTYSDTPRTADVTHQVSWASSNPKVATVDAAGVVTAMGPGKAIITAQEKNGAVSATQKIAAGVPDLALPGLVIYGPGSGLGKVSGTAVSPDGSVQPIDCVYDGTSNGSDAGRGCRGNFAPGTMITLTATQGNGTVFDGWSKNCAQSAVEPHSCTVMVNNNTSVGAIFDPR